MNRLRIIGLCTLVVMVILSWARLASAVESGITHNDPPPNQDGQKFVVVKKNSLAEMREWLNRRNLDRKLKGLLELQNGQSPDGKLTANIQSGRGATKIASEWGRTQKRRGHMLNRPVRTELHPPPTPPPLGIENLELYSTTLSPDGRIHHRLIINEEGPDQFQVANGTGYTDPNSISSPKPKRWVRPPFKR